MTSKQRAYLKSLAMKMDPIMQLGKGSVTPENTASVDEALEKVGRGIGSFNESQTRSLMEKLQHAKTPNVLPFKQSLEAVSELHNRPHQLAADGENVYLLPLSQTCVVTDS